MSERRYHADWREGLLAGQAALIGQLRAGLAARPKMLTGVCPACSCRVPVTIRRETARHWHPVRLFGTVAVCRVRCSGSGGPADLVLAAYL